MSVETFQQAFVQSPAEYEENVKIVEARLLRDGAVIAGTARNGRVLSEYLLKHYKRADGLVNATPQNLYSSIMRLHSTGMIDWVTVPPKKKVQTVQGVTRIKSDTQQIADQRVEFEKAARARATTEEQQERHSAVQEIMGACEALLTSSRTSRPPNYAKTQRLRDALREMIRKAGQPKSVQAAEALYQSLLDYSDKN